MLNINDNEFSRLVSYMRENYGINLTHKRALVEGRLSNTVTELGFKNYNDYLDLCFSDKTGKEID
ncbi:MAG: chemotaxis protein CheR, partial [Ruminiclostridium sp.]|nr:chemotaxis protein CheR [Ruminiclostridium sp.]